MNEGNGNDLSSSVSATTLPGFQTGGIIPPHSGGITIAGDGITVAAPQREHAIDCDMGEDCNCGEQEVERPPRDQLIRALEDMRVEDRSAVDGALGTMTGHFAVFDVWSEINSVFEGNFMERFAPGAFSKTFREQRDQMKVTLNHGMDPQAGDKPLGPIDLLEQDDTGARYDVPLLDTSYNRDILPGLRAGLYGASFRFRVMKERVVNDPEKSDANPDGLPERTVEEAQVFEFGPVTFPAYPEASAGVRSLTDAFLFSRIFQRFAREPALLDEAMKLARGESSRESTEPETVEPEPTTRRGLRAIPATLGHRRKDVTSWEI